ncbi:hypothetical protein EJB05_41629, partial [Eragrostis curvula]
MALSARRPRPKYAAALLSPSCLEELRVPAEFAARLGGEEGGGGTVQVLLVSPLGKVWRVELRRASGRWQLGGGGWAEFAAAHGVGAGWCVVFRVERRGVAAVRAFDAAGCLAHYCTPLAGVAVKRRPRFIRSLHPEDLQEMKMPDKFVQEHLTESGPSSQKATIFSRLGKFWHIELDPDRPGVLQGDGWMQFLKAHDLSEGNVLLFRYEGNMLFRVEVFLQTGLLEECEAAAAANRTDDDVAGPSEPQQGSNQPGVSHVKMKRKNTKENSTCLKGSDKKPKVPSGPANKVASQKKLVRQRSFTKLITDYHLKFFFAVKLTICSSVGLLGACEITLKTSVDKIKSWRVSFNTANTFGYLWGPGWKRFCQENKIKEGSCCTFNIVKTRIWHVIIASS